MEVVKMKNILIGMLFVAVVFGTTCAWALTPGSQTVTVSANVPSRSGGLTVGISKVTGTVWTANQTSISFGTLTWNTTNNIFLPDSYYAVDLGVDDNSGVAWTITHTRSSLAGQGTNINDKVNVAFVKQTSSSVGTELQKVSFDNSQNIAYTKAQLDGGWLRIYYGIGTGQTSTVLGADATGVTPIGMDTPAGTYTGSVTFTLAAV